MARRADLVDLTRDGCLRLLGTATIGRVVFTEAAMPAVEPVAYVLDGAEVVFRVPPGGVLAAAALDAVVGFQVDSIDPTTCAGWSVLGIGTAHQILDPDRRLSPAGRETVISVPLERLSGRRLHLGTVPGPAEEALRP